MEFIEASPPSLEMLRRLAASEGSIRVRRLLRSVSKTQSTWTAFLLIAITGLVRLGRQGVSITDLGHEILARMSNNNTAWTRSDSTPAVVEATVRNRYADDANNDASVRQVVPVAVDRIERARLPEPARLIQNWKPGHLESKSVVFSASDSRSKSDVTKSSPVMITTADHRELTDAIVAARKLSAHDGATRELQEKLADAVVLCAGDIPADVITLYSRAELLDLDVGEQLKLILVFPIDSNLEQGRISVFHRLGISVLGRRVGDRFDWSVPYGVKRFLVTAVDFQPEAALAKAA